jgi:hypothetical protein
MSERVAKSASARGLHQLKSCLYLAAMEAMLGALHEAFLSPRGLRRGLGTTLRFYNNALFLGIRYVTHVSKFCSHLDLKHADHLPEGTFCQ